MNPVLFWIFAAIMLLFGIMVIAMRSPVSSALSLVVSFIALAVLFVSLNAYFIGIIQIMVYAGAVMVLFLFIIMLLDLRGAHARYANVATIAGSILIAAIFTGELLQVLAAYPEGRATAPRLALPVNDVQSVGHELFTNYNLPFQVVAVLVLVATIGVVVLSKRELD